MSNHIHLLVRVNEIPVYRMVHYFAMMYAKYFNYRHDLVGHLFQGRYKSRHVNSDSYLLQLLRYIHRNPVAGNLVAQVEDYRWSSLQTYLGLSDIDWLTTTCGLAYFNGNPAALLDFVRTQLEDFDPLECLENRRYQARNIDDESRVPQTYAWANVGELIATAADRFDVSVKELQGSSTKRELTIVRCWIGSQAVRSGVASLCEVARLLNRAPASLSRSIRRNAERLEKAKG